MNPDLHNFWKLPGPAENDGRLGGYYARSLKLAFEMHNAGRPEEAEALCRLLLHVRPNDAQLLFLLGMVLHKTNQDHEAVGWLSLAAERQPQSARIWNGLGCARQNLADYARAADAFARGLELDPRAAANYYNLGRSCFALDQMERAAALFRRAVELNPRDTASWNNLGKCLKELNRLDESLAAYDRAIELAPDYAVARYGRALSLLTAGRWAEGFVEYEWRRHFMKRRQFARPEWSGAPAPDGTLLLHAEQGFGDAIQMIRLIPAARERVARIILECRPELTTLFQHSKCADTVIPHGAPIPAFDCFLPLSSLTRVLGVMPEKIPGQTPWLRAPEGRPLPSARPGRLKVGLVWAGNPGHNQDAMRSVPLPELAPILRTSAVDFYSLQQAAPIRDEACLHSFSGILHSLPAFTDFLDTASVIAQLDLVISVDTAVAHLAGALNKPVWLLVQHSPDWRWLLERTDTPWYPSMRLYRQVERGRWKTPVLRLTAALRRLAAAHAAHDDTRSATCPAERRRDGPCGTNPSPRSKTYRGGRTGFGQDRRFS